MKQHRCEYGIKVAFKINFAQKIFKWKQRFCSSTLPVFDFSYMYQLSLSCHIIV